jgi:hypothetical protein
LAQTGEFILEAEELLKLRETITVQSNDESKNAVSQHSRKIFIFFTAGSFSLNEISIPATVSLEVERAREKKNQI